MRIDIVVVPHNRPDALRAVLDAATQGDADSELLIAREAILKSSAVRARHGIDRYTHESQS